ncbi:GNAT family N-acetyltransferase [Streptomyces sp. NPDC001880]
MLTCQDDLDDRDIEFTYGNRARYRRQGSASEAVTVATEYAVQRLGAWRVLLRIEAGDAPSAAVARTAGFRPTTDESVAREAQGPAGAAAALGRVRRIMAGGAASGTAPRGVAETSEQLRCQDAPAPCDAPHRTPRPVRP